MSVKYAPTVVVSTEWIDDIIHAVGSLAQFFLTHGEGGDIKREEALIEQGCEYLHKAELTFDADVLTGGDK